MNLIIYTMKEEVRARRAVDWAKPAGLCFGVPSQPSIVVARIEPVCGNTDGLHTRTQHARFGKQTMAIPEEKDTFYIII